MDPRFPRSCVLNANSFYTVCEAEHPMAWSVTQFYDEVTSPMSGLERLLNAYITNVICYHRRGPVSHDYLILCIRMRESQDRFQPSIWARCERHPGSVQGSPLMLSTVTPAAMDTIKFSFNRAKLKHPSDTVIMESAFDSLQVLHVADLLKTIHSVSPSYGVASYNCWWFAAVAIGTLQVFGKDWTIAPSRDWVKSAVKVLGRNTAEASDEVTRRFVQAWNIGAEAEFAPLTSDQAWTNHDSQHQVPILNRQMRRYEEPLRVSTLPIPINVPRPNQGPQPSPGYPGNLPSQHSRIATIPAPPPNISRANVIWSPDGLRSSPESGLVNPPLTLNPSSSENAELLPSSEVFGSIGQTSTLSQSQRSVTGTSALQFRTGNTPPPVYEALSPEFTHPVEPSNRTRRRTDASETAFHPVAPSHYPHRDTASSYPQEDGIAGSSRGITMQPRNQRFAPPPPLMVPEEGDVEIESSRAPVPGVSNGLQSPIEELPSPHGSNTWGPSPRYTPSVYSNGEYETLPELIMRIIWSSNSIDVQVLLATYPSFATGSDLLQELKSYFKHTPRDHEHANVVRPRVIEILRQWVTSESFDSTLGSELQKFLGKQVAADPNFARSQDVTLMSQKLARPPDPSDDEVRPSSSGGSSLDIGIASASSTRGFMRRPSSRGMASDSLGKMKDKDLTELARVLEAMEMKFRSSLTIPRVVRWLAWRKGAGSASHRVFSPHSERIAAWVLDSCLQGSIDNRATTYSKLISLAEQCAQAGNLASVSDLLYGLRSSMLTRLEHTRKLAGNVDTRLNDLSQSLHPRNPSRLPSLNSRMQALVGPFEQTMPEPGRISWSRCQLLYTELQKAVALPVQPSPLPVNPSYHSFIAISLHTAWQNRGNHGMLSQRIAADEPEQMRRWKRHAAGFNG